MAITSCDHDTFIVTYDTKQGIQCPVCGLQLNSEIEINDLQLEIDGLEDDIRVLNDEVYRLQKEVQDV